MSGVLDGIRVLDFGRYIAGPYCATLLAELGADVIRIEKVSGSEDRFLTPVSEGGPGALFLQMARNKRGLTLNPKTPAGAEIVAKLAATADVVVANLPPQALVGMGIDYTTLKAIKPDIILATTSAFGRGGPPPGDSPKRQRDDPEGHRRAKVAHDLLRRSQYVGKGQFGTPGVERLRTPHEE